MPRWSATRGLTQNEVTVREAFTVGGRFDFDGVGDIEWPASCVLVAVLHGPDVITPRGPTTLLPGDEVLAVMHSEATTAVAALLGPAAAQRSAILVR
jgi:Trk K+ transport system NAD-binding subunit